MVDNASSIGTTSVSKGTSAGQSPLPHGRGSDRAGYSLAQELHASLAQELHSCAEPGRELYAR